MECGLCSAGGENSGRDSSPCPGRGWRAPGSGHGISTDLGGAGDTTPGEPGSAAGGGSCGAGGRVSQPGGGSSRAGGVPGKLLGSCGSTAPGQGGFRLGRVSVQSQPRQGQLPPCHPWLCPAPVSPSATPQPPEPPEHGTHRGGPARGQGGGCSSSGNSGQGSGSSSCREWRGFRQGMGQGEL